MSSVINSSSINHPPVVSNGEIVKSIDNKILEKAVEESLPQNIPLVIVHLMTSYTHMQGVFTEYDWNELCGRVAPAPPLPQNIEEIWEGPCPFFLGKRVKESHILVYLPTTVDDKPLTLKVLGEIARRHFSINEKVYQYRSGEIEKQVSNQPIAVASWVLMTKAVVEESRNKSYTAQQTIITELAKKAQITELAETDQIAYTVPTTAQAAICILTHYMRTRTRLFSDTYTRCQESLHRSQLIVGAFSPDCLEIDNYDTNGTDLGMAAVRNLS